MELIRRMKRNKMLVFMVVVMVFLVVCLSTTNLYATTYISGGVDIDSVRSNVTIVSIQPDERAVYDDGQFASTQPYEVVSLSRWGYDCDDLILEGYNTIVVIFQISIKEVNDGYQELYLYTTSNSNAANLVTGIEKFEHTPGKKDSNYKRYEFYAEIKIDSIIDNRICFRFDANGDWEDTWKYKAFDAQVLVSKEHRKFTSLLYIGQVI